MDMDIDESEANPPMSPRTMARELAEARRSLRELKELVKQKDEQLHQTTLEEYLRSHHESGTGNLRVANAGQCTTGTTSVEGKYYPENILRWRGCEAALRKHYDEIWNVFHPPGGGAPRVFQSRSSIRDTGNFACQDPLSCEKDVAIHQLSVVENPVRSILSKLVELAPQKAEDLAVGHGVRFPNPTNSLTESRTRLPNNRICIYLRPRENQEDEEVYAFIIEYKPPHKLSVGDLRRALDTPGLCQKATSGDADSGEEIAAKAITQTFDYMIKLGHEYGYLTTAEAFVFLRVRRIKGKEKYFKRLYYHMVVPRDDVGGGGKDGLFYSAVGQVASFCLMSFKSRKNRKSWRAMAAQAKVEIKRWYAADAISHLPPDEVVEVETSSPSWTRGSQESASTESSSSAVPGVLAVTLRPRKKPNAVQQDNDGEDEDGDDENDEDDDDDDEEDDDEEEDDEEEDEDMEQDGEDKNEGDTRDSDDHQDDSIGTPQTASLPRTAVGSRPGAGSAGSKGQPSANRGSSRRSHKKERRVRRYCTQACLMGLKRGSPLDGSCPNVASHRRLGDGVHHPIAANDLPRLLREQLGQSVHRHCKPLGLQGSRGALFKLTLSGYGYTFVAKGTVSSFVPDLRREGRWYQQQLDGLQGDAVPVHLGNIDLMTGYYLDLDVDIVHMLLMSWGGQGVDKVDGAEDVPDLAGETERTLREVRKAGVVHRDARPANMLWNAERRRVMLIDFDRSVRVPTPKRVSELARRKRDRQAEDTGICHRKRMVGVRQ